MTSPPGTISRKSTSNFATLDLLRDRSHDSSEQQQSSNGIPQALKEFNDHIKKGVANKLDTATLSSVVDAIAHNNDIDDRKLLMEHILNFISRLPDGPISQKLNDMIIQLLYNDLDHPPATLLGKEYSWRTADGSKNNIQIPDMGKAGMPYARSVQQTHPLPQQALPDPGLLFDTLLRRDGFKEHPAGCSSLMFSFAALVIHTVFRTSHRDPTINETSSYVDLSPLYGHNQEAQDKVRVRDGRGCVRPDCFSEDRLLLLPPAVCVLLVLFSRNHNYIAKKLLEINERGNFVDPPTLDSNDPKQQKKLMDQDEEIFQVARLINANWFATVVFSDYLSSILGMVRQGSSWILNPFEEMRNADHSVFERGKGNVCSVEFNSLYRWHATTSRNDTKWNDDLFKKIFPNKDFQEVTVMDFRGAKQEWHKHENDLSHWTFGNIQRQADGTFRDEDLARFLKDAIDDPAGAFRARGTPDCMRLQEIMGIESNRAQGVCSLNDFRKYLGLRPFKSFKEWNSDPKVYEVAEKLYGDIENLELYVGLQAEEAKPVIPGAGLCPGYTISRAILSDAVALTRGDRFFTTNKTPYNLTAWGYADCDRTPEGAGFGGALGRLFLRTLPGQFTHDSVYTWFPMITPKAMSGFLKDLGNKEYSIERPREVSRLSTLSVSDYNEAAQVLKNPGLISPHAARAGKVIKGKGFYTASDNIAQADKDRADVIAALTGPSDVPDRISSYFYETTCKLIKANSYPLIGVKTQAVDIVRDVLKVVPIVWVAEEIAGITVKTNGSSSGLYTASQLFEKISDIYSYMFLEVDASKLLKLEEKVKADVDELLGHIKTNLGFVSRERRSIVGQISRFFIGGKPNNADYEKKEIAKRLRDLGRSNDELANMILAIMVGSTVEMSLALTNMINGSLDSQKISELKSTSSPAQLEQHVEKLLATDPPFQGVYRVGKTTAASSSSERIFVDVARANTQIPNGSKPLSPNHLYACLGESITHKIMSNMLRAVYSLDDVQRGAGKSGLLPCFNVDTEPAIRHVYLQNGKVLSPWPSSLVVQYMGSA